jgi:DNA-binding beta-propeller fold protein YncE
MNPPQALRTADVVARPFLLDTKPPIGTLDSEQVGETSHGRVASEHGEGAAVSTAIGVDEGRRSGIQRGSVGHAPRASAGAVAPGRPHARRAAAILCVTLGVLLMCSAQALAAGQRQHLFSFTFGSLGTGAGQFFHPTGVGANAVSGDVYVSDRENGRVEGFQPVYSEGRLVGETPLQDAVEGGGFKPAQAKVPLAEQIAVDNCTSESKPCTGDPSLGDIYVVGGTKTQSKKAEANPANDAELYKFNAELKPVGGPRTFKEPIDGVAVDPSGNVFVYQADGRISELNDAEVNEGVAGASVQAGFDQELERPAFAVDSHGNFYAGTEANAEEGDGDPGVEGLLQELDEEEVGVIAKLAAGTGDVLIHELDYEASRAVAVNPADVPANGVDEENDVYVTGLESVVGEPTTSISAFSPAEGEGSEATGEGKLVQRFSAPGLKEGEGIAVDPATGTVYVTDGASNRVDVFELEPAGKPSTSSPSETLESGVRTLTAQVSAAGSEARAYFEYGTATCATEPSRCTSTVPVTLAAGYGGQEVAANLPNLAPGAYRYRVVAENAQGRVQSPEATFNVIQTLGALPDGRAWEMVSPPEKDGAEPEAITKERGAIQAAANGDAITYVADGPMPAGAAPEGNRGPEPTQILSTRDRPGGEEPWESQDIATPNSTGSGTNPGLPPEYQFFSSDLALALVEPWRAESGPFESPPLSPPIEAGEKQENTPYLRADLPLKAAASAMEETDFEVAKANGEAMTPRPNAGFLPLVTKLNAPGTEFGVEYPAELGIYIEGATSDLSHVVLTSERTTAAPGLYEWAGNGTSTEETRENGERTLQPISLLPGNQTLVPAPQAGLGSGGSKQTRRQDVRNAISSDGNLVFWSRTPESGGVQLFVRDAKLHETVALSGSEADAAIFQTANATGSKVYFTDNAPLTSYSHATSNAPDLYVAELQEVGTHLEVKITDLTPEAGADLLAPKGGDGVIGASESQEEEEGGANVYFLANGALAPGATRGRCSNSGAPRPAGITCNLFVRHYDESSGEWEPAKLIAMVSQDDVPAFEVNSPNLLYMTARVSPNGRYLAFMSSRRLTGYDNIDQDEATGLHADEEVYLYNAQSGHLVCASCNPSGARPTGVLDTKVADGEGLTLVVDRQESWAEKGADHWLSASVPGWDPINTVTSPYQSRYLSDSGRLFFNSADPLLPAGSVPGEQRTKMEHTTKGQELEVGVENVYEYEAGATGGCQSEGGCVGLISSATSEHESAFLDASEDGNDAFFLTAAQLAPQDQDSNFDVYDAHVCEGEGSCPAALKSAPTSCGESEGCQGVAPSTSSVLSPEVVPFTAGNLAAPKQEVLGKKVVKTPPKPLTRAQKFAKAMKLCRKDKSKTKRVACEKKAKSKYGPKKKSSSKGKGKG